MRACRRWAAALAGCALVLTGCAGVPDSSTPQTVEPVRVEAGDSQAPAAPQKNASARSIVQDFLDANGSDPDSRSSARAYLTTAARNQWSDQRVTIIANRQISTFDPTSDTVQVTGNVVGTLNSQGIYQPSLLSASAAPASFPFVLKQVDGQYRIDQLRSGLLITDDQFRQSYQEHVVYFYDLLEHNLVPDVRWTDIPGTDVVELGNWLVDQLVEPSRPEIEDAVSTETFPAQATADRVSVHGSSSALTVDIPGSSQLDPSVRNLLAVQLARTLAGVVAGGTLSITDSGVPVSVPQLGVTAFEPDVFAQAPVSTAPDVYYVNAHRVVGQDGSVVNGPLGHNYYGLTSIAVGLPTANGTVGVAGVGQADGASELYVGTVAGGLRPTGLTGQLTRPTFAPGDAEVWIGDGAELHRVTLSGSGATDSIVQLPMTLTGNVIQSVRISPDGTQIALVISPSGTDAGQLYVGAVTRDATSVRVTGLTPLNSPDVTVTDVAWSTPLRLIATGESVAGQAPGIYTVGVDGTFWTSLGLGELPGAAVNITASEFGVWVESGGQVWEQQGTTWGSPSASGQVFGQAPIYSA